MKSLIEQITGKCRHFNGLMNDKCDVGIEYDSVRPPKEEGKRWPIPCIKEWSDGCHCERQSFPTKEEAEAEELAHKERFARTMAARTAIVNHLGGPWKKGMTGSQGVIDCPCCKKERGLHFSRSGYNGHIHARCETDGCVSWME